MRVALVNTNRIRPPIAPIGLDYVAEALSSSGHEVDVLDLCWADDSESAIASFLHSTRFDLIGLTVRNTDDCAFSGRQSFLREIVGDVAEIRRDSEASVVLGGVGFSVMPETVLDLCKADAGVWGDGEFALVEIANRMRAREDWRSVPNLIWRHEDGLRSNPPALRPLTDLPPMSRAWFDNRRYFREGGQAGVETKRGCSGLCIYCADPVAKGRNTRVRPPEAVADELERLLAQGIDHVHTCDSEFNIPEWHARAVSEEILRRGLGDNLRWYAYCSPVPFSEELARLMRCAGCVGINFGVDHGDDQMLTRLRRSHAPDDIVNVARWCKGHGMAVMFDLLLGSPGESRESVVRTVELMRRSEPDRVGVTLGVRVYPGTELENQVQRGNLKAGLVGGSDPCDPLFFLEPAVAPFVFEWLDDLVGDDNRFLFFDPSKPERNYNYNANQRLVDAIGQGHRGAYWDILRKIP